MGTTKLTAENCKKGAKITPVDWPTADRMEDVTFGATYTLVADYDDSVAFEDDVYDLRARDLKEFLLVTEDDESVLTGGSSDYYKLPEGAKDLMDLIEHKNMSFSVGNIFKACYRLGQKTGATRKYDLEKIIWFANRELAKELGNG